MKELRRFRDHFHNDRFVRNLGWMGIGELGIRLSRLVTTVLLARLLTPHDYGLAAIVLMTTEFIRVFTRNGIGDKIVQADSREVEDLCQTAWCLNWLVGISLFAIQFCGSFLVARFYSDSSLILPIMLIGGTYLVYPLAMVQTALVRRENRFKIFSLVNLAQVVSDNILTSLLALNGWGQWAIVLPKLVVAPIWVGMILNYEPWRPAPGFTLLHWSKIFGFGSRILAVELLNVFRENVDYLMIGRLLSLRALGVYYFAFNAGLGFSLSVINAIGVSLYSDLCDIRSQPDLLRRRFGDNIRTTSLVMMPLVLLQCSLAPLYVPVLFGSTWVAAGALPILMLICLSALSRPFANASSMLFRAVGLPQVDLHWNMVFTAVLILAILLGTLGGILGVAVAVAVVHLGLQPIYLLMGQAMLRRRQNLQLATH